MSLTCRVVFCRLGCSMRGHRFFVLHKLHTVCLRHWKPEVKQYSGNEWRAMPGYMPLFKAVHPPLPINETIKRHSRKFSRVLILNFRMIPFSAFLQDSEEKIQCCPCAHALCHEDKALAFYVLAQDARDLSVSLSNCFNRRLNTRSIQRTGDRVGLDTAVD
jgi:hypothetical protein